MTKQEAIEYLELIRTCDAKPVNEALKMAIKVLRQDSVDRVSLVTQLKHLNKFNNNDCPEWVFKVIEGM